MNSFLDKSLRINCGMACIMKDSNGVLDKYDKIQINCGDLITSGEISAKLAEKGASINAGKTFTREIKGKVIQLKSGCTIGGGIDYEGAFLLASGDVIVLADGDNSLNTAEGMIVAGTLYYPESAGMSFISKISGDTKSYPDDTHIVLGRHKLANLINNIPKGEKNIWVTGEIEALDDSSLDEAIKLGLTITCKSLFTYDCLNEKYGDLFITTSRKLIPEGYEIVDELSSSEIAFYGSKLYVRGDFTLDIKDAACLDELESIIVKGRANIPVSLAKTFRKIGKADSYFAYEGILYDVDGFDQFTHEQLQAMIASGNKYTIRVNGSLLFMNGVIAEDIEAITAFYYNGAVFIPSEAKGALSSRVREANGFMGSVDAIQEMAGLSLEEIMGKMTGGDGASNINTGVYILI